MKKSDVDIASLPTLAEPVGDPAEAATLAEPDRAAPDRAAPDPAEDDGSVAELLQRVRGLRREPPRRIRQVAAGGMARIVAVHEPALDRRSAMKVLRTERAREPRSVAWFIREAHVTGQLDHPNIVPVHDVGVLQDGDVYFTMKLVEGRTFQQWVDALPPRPLERAELLEALGVLVKVCDAVAFAHSRGVVHADIKPANVMVGSYGQVYLMDWGIARLRGAAAPPPADEARDEEGELAAAAVRSWIRQPVTRGAGSPGFIAPEQAAGNDPDERADVFGVGGLLYYLLARRPPFSAATLADTCALALAGRVPAVEAVAPGGRVPRALAAIVGRALAKRPDDRHPSVRALQDELQSFLWSGGDFPIVTYEAGEHVVLEGEGADAAYVIVAGACEVYHAVEGRRRTLARLERGDVFGETAIFAGTTRTANVVAVAETSLVRIPNDVFEQELDGMKPWMSAFARAVARRLRTQLQHGRATTERQMNHAHDLIRFHLERLATARGGTIPFGALVERLCGRYAMDEEDVRRAVAASPEVTVDEAGDRVTVTDPAALRANLAID